MEEVSVDNNQGGGFSAKKILLGVVVIAVLAGGAYWFLQGQNEGDIIVGDGDEQKEEGELIIRDANVTDVEVLTLESFPLQIRVVAKGEFPDSCTQIGEADVTQEESTFFITITTKRLANAICAQVITPFEEVVVIDATGLLKGTYMVNVNGVERMFELQFDNVFPKG